MFRQLQRLGFWQVRRVPPFLVMLGTRRILVILELAPAALNHERNFPRRLAAFNFKTQGCWQDFRFHGFPRYVPLEPIC